jgi:hypothetical protein
MHTFLYVFSILGAGFKLGSVAVLDEIGLIVFSIRTVFNNKIRLQFSIFHLLLLYFMFISLQGIYYENINSLRYILIPVLLLIYTGHENNLLNVKYLIITCFSFIFLNIILPIYGFINLFEVAYWQDWLWTGTAYSSIAVYISGVILIGFLEKNSSKFAVVVMVILAAILTDSRFLSALSLILILSLMFLPKKKSGKRRVFNSKYLYIILVSIALLVAFNRNEMFSGVVGSVIATATQISSDDNRDSDRKENISAVIQLSVDDTWHFLFGHGTLSHQVDLSKYMDKSGDGKVRPIGFTAIIFDGGLVLLALITLSAIQTLYMTIRRVYLNRVPFYLMLLYSSLPVVGLLSIFITNTLDMIIWWLIMAPNGLGYLAINRFNKGRSKQ